MANMHSTVKLGKLTPVSDLREAWPNEATDFTPWLAENLDMLSDVLGIDMEHEASEVNLGSFRLDLQARETGDNGRTIAIENQIEYSDHKHLGQVITYASKLDAKIIIWIVKRAREEHREAVEWLNNNTDISREFYLIETELWRIGDSLMAPRFNVVVQPNEREKILANKDELSEGKLLQLQFWNSFKEEAWLDSTFSNAFRLRKAHARPNYDLWIGYSHCHLILKINTYSTSISAGLYIKNDKALYNLLKDDTENLSLALGQELNFHESEKDSSIFVTLEGKSIANRDEWPEIFSWFRKQALTMKQVFTTRVDKISESM